MQGVATLLLTFMCQRSLVHGAASGVCVHSYSDLRDSLLSTQGNIGRLLSAFFPSGESSPDVVDVTYMLCNSYDNVNLECDDPVDAEEANYTWTDNQLFLSLDPEYFQISTVWLFQLRKSSVNLIIQPFCAEFNLSESSQAQMLLTLTSWVSYKYA